MNKNISKVKELLHIDLFARINKDLHCEKIIVDMGSGDDGDDPNFVKAIAALPEEYTCDFGFIGGVNKSLFYFQLLIAVGLDTKLSGFV